MEPVQVAPSQSADVMVAVRAQIDAARRDMFQMLTGKELLLEAMAQKPENQSHSPPSQMELANGVAILIVSTIKCTYEDASLTVKYPTLLERIVKKSAPYFGVGDVNRKVLQMTIREAIGVDDGKTIVPEHFRSGVKFAQEPEDVDILWFAVMCLMKTHFEAYETSENKETVGDFINRFYAKILEILELIAFLKKNNLHNCKLDLNSGDIPQDIVEIPDVDDEFIDVEN